MMSWAEVNLCVYHNPCKKKKKVTCPSVHSYRKCCESCKIPKYNIYIIPGKRRPWIQQEEWKLLKKLVWNTLFYLFKGIYKQFKWSIGFKKNFLWFSDIPSPSVLIINYCCCVNIAFFPLNGYIELCCLLTAFRILQIFSWKWFIVFKEENSAFRVLINHYMGRRLYWNTVLLGTDILTGARTIWLEASKWEISCVILGL